jgi:endo-1,3-1,4-beta-glycanase ExoK
MTPRNIRARRPARGLRRTVRAAALAGLALAAACSDMTTDPAPDAPEARAPQPAPVVVEEFDGPSFGEWYADTHPLGRGSVRAEHVALGGGRAALSLAAGGWDGAEILTSTRYGPGAYEARMRTPHAPGSLSAFFLYQGGATSDEIDIEIFNDGTRRIMFTTFVAGKQTNNVTATLPFDPTAAYHDYRIEWAGKSVRFLVDGVVMQEFRRGVPRSAMYVMANTWWPVWLSGPLLTEPAVFDIDRIRTGG